MKEIDRRSVLTGIICGSAVATVGSAIMPKAAKSLPLANIKAGAVKPEGLFEEARVTVHVHPRRRHRPFHWRCWCTGDVACAAGANSNTKTSAFGTKRTCHSR